MECIVCRKPVAKPKRGPAAKTCGQRCRKRLSRMRAGSVFPKDMVSAGRWVRADEKRPIMVDGRPASSNRASTWADFGAVQQGAGDGFGFMLGDGFAVLDLDDCFGPEGELSPLACRVVRLNPDAFIERSMSGRGLHVFGYLPEAKGDRLEGIEIYSRARFVRTTGDVFQGGGLPPLKY